MKKKNTSFLRFCFLPGLLLLLWLGSAFQPLYSQNTFTFTSAGATGRLGPTQTQVNTSYSLTNLSGSVTINTQGIQEFTIPMSSMYYIETWGAGDPYSGGAKISGQFSLTAGQKLFIAVGQQGDVTGGHGGSYVATGATLGTSTPLIVAGGGGGNLSTFYDPTQLASYSTGGNPGDVGFGGTNGSGGYCNTNNTLYGGGGGGGFYGSGNNTSSYSDPGIAFILGAIGGQTGLNNANAQGGFGGGGAGFTALEPGGGGGYSGGGGGGFNGQSSTGVAGDSQRVGGGGGSYNGGTNQVQIGINNSGAGQVLLRDLFFLTISPTATINCFGQTNAALTTSVNSGNAPYTYTWSTGSHAASISGLSAGTYSCAITDALSRTTTATYTVTQPAALAASVLSQTNVTCNGGSNGALIVTLSGGTAPYTYSWSPISNTTPTASGLYAGTYTCNVHDANGCSTSATAAITQPATFAIGATASNPAICIGGSTTLNGSGAVSYAWTGGVTNGVSFSPGATTSYTVTGTNGAGCTSTAAITVTVNPLPSVPIGGVSTICTGNSTTLTASGAVTYSWSTAATSNSISVSPVANTVYSVTGTDANSCQKTTTINVTVNPLPAVTASASSTSVCTGNTLTLNGGGAVSYAWTGGATNGVAFVPASSSVYTVTGTDVNSCQKTATINVIVNPLPTVNANSTGSAVCQGQPVTLSGSGSATTYTWTGGITNGTAFTPASTATYVVTGIDVNSCHQTASISIVVNTLPVVIAGTSTNAVCAGQSVTLNGSGASTYTWTGGVTDGVAFAPSSTASYSVSGTNSAGCTNTIAAAVTVTVNAIPSVSANTSTTAVCDGGNVILSGSGASTYTWTGGVTDGVAFVPSATDSYTVAGTSTAGCTSTNVAITSVTVNALPVVTANTSTTAVCDGQSLTLTGSGASTYTWTGGVTDGGSFAPSSTNSYSVTGTSTAGCTSTNVAAVTITVNALPTVTANATSTFICINSTVVLSGSGAATYTWTGSVTDGAVFSPTSTLTYSVTGTSAAGCGSANTDTITITVNDLPTVTASASTPSVCDGGNVTLSGSGASTYTWTGGITDGAAFVPSITDSYTVTGTSTAGCTSTNVAVTSVTVIALPLVAANTSTTAVCEGQSLTLTGSGASTYTWTGGVTDAIAFAPSATGSYTVTGTSTAGCTSTNVAAVTITVNALPILSANATGTFICINNTVILSGSGANTYTWTNGITDGVAFSPTSTVTYSVTGTSTAGCLSANAAAITVTVNALPTVIASASTSSLCAGYNVILSGSGASTYTWTGGVTDGAAFIPSATNSYTLTGTDLAGCTSTNVAVTSVTVVALPTVSANTTASAVCPGYPVTLTGSGASTYTWSSGITDGSAFVPSSTASYTVTGTSTAGCTSTNVAVITITVNAMPTVTANATNTFICLNETVTLSGSGANTYLWSNGITDGSVFSPTATATYSVSGLNGVGCTSTNTDVITVIVNPLPVVTANTSTTALCAGSSATLTGSGANTYTWTGGVTNGTAFTPSLTNTYTVTGTSTAGCTSTNIAVTTITVNAIPTVTANASTNSVCAGQSVTLNGAGAGTYTWTGATNGAAFAPSSTSSYTVTGTSTAGCTSTNVAAVTVTVNVLPVVTANTSTNAVCAGSSVTLNGGNANSYTWTSSSGTVANAVAFAPSTTDTYSVIGSSTANCVSANTATVAVNVNALPTLTASANSTTVCINNSVTLTGTGANTYTWTGGVTNGLAFAPAASGVYTVTGANANSCLGTATISITVYSLPTVTANSSTTSVCEGQSVTLNGGGASTYAWTGGGIDGIAFAPSGTNSYSVTGTSTAGCTSTNVAVATVTVYALPVVTANTSTNAVCAGNSVTLNGGGANTYTWTGGGIDGVAFIPSGTDSYSVSGTSTAGCTSTNVAAVTVTVNALPIVTISASSNAICLGGTVSLNGSGATTYTWSNAGSNGAVFSPTSTATYTVTGTDINSCQGSATISVLVNTPPTVTASASKTLVCSGSMVTLSGSGADTYTWSNGVTDGAAFQATTNATYTLTGTSVAGCTSTNAAVVSISVNALPVVTASTSSAVICQGSSITLNGGGANTYSWSSGAIDNTAFAPSSSQTYTVTGTDANGCNNTATIALTVNTLPVLSVVSSNSSACSGQPSTLTVSGANSYTWGPSLNGTFIAVTPTATSAYTVQGTDGNNCSSFTTYTQLVVPCNASVTAVASQTDVSCHGRNNGRIAIETSISYPENSISYLWSEPGLCPNNNCSTVNGLPGGTYSVLVVFTYTAAANFTKTDTVALDPITVQDLNPPCDVTVYSGVMPNSSWKIDNIELYRKNKVTVFNRWGKEMMSMTSYDNDTKSWPKQEDLDKLAAGTYYYIIDLGDGSSPLKGWIELFKN